MVGSGGGHEGETKSRARERARARARVGTGMNEELEAERPVDVAQIEKSLAELWRTQQDGEDAITRAALWNVVAHTSSSEQHTQATEILGRASAAVPQRTIVIHADAAA